MGLFRRLLVGDRKAEGTVAKQLINLTPGELVPKTGRYKCNVCMIGGMTDVAIKALIRAGKFGGMEHLKRERIDPIVIRRALRLLPVPPGLEHSNFARVLQAESEMVRAFEEGQRFTECPTCGGAAGWTLLEFTDDLVRKYHDM